MDNNDEQIEKDNTSAKAIINYFNHLNTNSGSIEADENEGILDDRD